MGYSDDGKENRVVQLRKGILELAVMGVLERERHYGYSIVRILTENGLPDLKEGTIYPILARLDRDGLVRSEWVESAQGPPRKYYSLAPAGRRLFADLITEFDVLVALVKSERLGEAKGSEPEPAGRKLAIRKR